jgi:hypothetical protein
MTTVGPVVQHRLGCAEANVLHTYRHFDPGADQQAADLTDRSTGVTSSTSDAG